jgi:hypothetical protein
MAARWQRSRRGTRQKFGRMGLQLVTGCHRPKFFRGGCLDASGTAATATKERLTGAEATKATAAVVRSSRSAGAAGVVRQHDAGGRGAELLKQKGWPGPVVEGARSAGRGGGLRRRSTCNHGPRQGAEREGRA